MPKRPELHVLLLDALEAEQRISATWYTIRTVSDIAIIKARNAGYIQLEDDSPGGRLCLTPTGFTVAKDLKEQYR